MKPGSYEKLNENGMIKENVYVIPGDIIIGKIIPAKINRALNKSLKIIAQCCVVMKTVILIKYI